MIKGVVMSINGFNINILKEKLLSNDYFKVDQVFIRGSYSNGNYSYKSDLDLLIISDDFTAIDIMKRKEFVRSIFEDIFAIKIDAICLTKYEYCLVRMDEEKNIGYDEMVEVIL